MPQPVKHTAYDDATTDDMEDVYMNLPAMNIDDVARPCNEAAAVTTLPYLYWLPTAYTASPVTNSQHAQSYTVNNGTVNYFFHP